MTILYFTSTGNSLMVAKKIGGKLISIPQALRNKQKIVSDNVVGLVFPVYGLCVPPLIEEFLDEIEIEANYTFAVLTYGTYMGGAVAQLEFLAAKKNMRFSYINCLHMQENYLPGFSMEKQKKPKRQDEKLIKICEDIDLKKDLINKSTVFDKFMSKTHQSNYHYIRGVGLTEDFTVSDACQGCGVCANVCPTNNIELVDGRPVYKRDCISCLACIHNCPKHAIDLKTQKSKGRYRNPQVELSEIINANQ